MNCVQTFSTGYLWFAFLCTCVHLFTYPFSVDKTFTSDFIPQGARIWDIAPTIEWEVVPFPTFLEILTLTELYLGNIASSKPWELHETWTCHIISRLCCTSKFHEVPQCRKKAAQGDDASAARQRFDQLCAERRAQVESWSWCPWVILETPPVDRTFQTFWRFVDIFLILGGFLCKVAGEMYASYAICCFYVGKRSFPGLSASDHPCHHAHDLQEWNQISNESYPKPLFGLSHFPQNCSTPTVSNMMSSYIYIYNMEYHSFILIAHIHSMTYIEREGEGCQEAGSTFCDFSKSWSRVTVHVRATKAPWDVPYRYTNLVEYMDMPPTWPSLFFVVSSGSHAHEHRSPISVLHNLSHEIAWGS